MSLAATAACMSLAGSVLLRCCVVVCVTRAFCSEAIALIKPVDEEQQRVWETIL